MNSPRHHGSQAAPAIRPREARDLPACVRALATVHAADRYPLEWPTDPMAWLAPVGLLGAWVAADEEAILGHVGLFAAQESAVAALWCDASDLPLACLGEVVKLFVVPTARGSGLGAELLACAVTEATARGLTPVLEVLDHDRAARALYERLGWRHLGSVQASWAPADGTSPLLHAYLSPR